MRGTPTGITACGVRLFLQMGTRNECRFERWAVRRTRSARVATMPCAITPPPVAAHATAAAFSWSAEPVVETNNGGATSSSFAVNARWPTGAKNGGRGGHRSLSRRRVHNWEGPRDADGEIRARRRHILSGCATRLSVIGTANRITARFAGWRVGPGGGDERERPVAFRRPRIAGRLSRRARRRIPAGRAGEPLKMGTPLKRPVQIPRILH